MSESNAILRHLGRKHDLYGSSEKDRVRIDVAQCVLYDQVMAMAKLLFNPDFVSQVRTYSKLAWKFVSVWGVSKSGTCSKHAWKFGSLWLDSIEEVDLHRSSDTSVGGGGWKLSLQ